VDLLIVATLVFAAYIAGWWHGRREGRREHRPWPDAEDC
jgi:hypothetical protein